MAWPSSRRPGTQAGMRDMVLRTYGIDESQDSELASIANEFLDQAVRDMNSHLYEFNKHTETINLVAGTNEYALTNTSTDTTDGSTIVPYKESSAHLIHSTNSTRLPMTYIPWVRFKEKLGNLLYANSGNPELYSFRNMQKDGKVTVWPTPADTTYDMVVEFYRRIPLYSDLTDENTAPNMPEEVETPLFYNACKRLAIHLLGPGHADVAGFEALENKALNELKAVDKRHPDQRQRFILSDHQNATRTIGRRTLYIKV